MREVLADKALEKAKVWASRAWMEAIASWSERSAQDYAYREHVIEPYLSTLISGLQLNSSSRVVEIGCGDGSHSIFWRKKMDSLGLGSVRILGVDYLDALIIKAREKAAGFRNISFEVGDATNTDLKKLIHDKVGAPDVIVAMFLLQDTPDLEGILKIVWSCLKDRGHFIAVIVHPAFAEHLLSAGHLKKHSEENVPDEYLTDSGLVLWRFIGYYPIAQSEAPPFYLPYFHRTVPDYHRAFEKNNFDILESKPLMPDKYRTEKLRNEKILPFNKSKWNIYWPLIVEEPSSLLIHAVKG